MRSLQSFKQQKGFTIVELLIVIVVIGILAALVIVTFSGIQQRARDTERKTDVNAIQGHVEAFYAQNGYYPTRGNLNTASWRATNTQGLDPAALADPSNASTQTLAAAAAAGSYAYEPETSAAASCESAQNTCATYALTATLEAGGTYVKQSN